MNGLRLQRALPPLIHGAVSQITEKKGGNEYSKSDYNELSLKGINSRQTNLLWLMIYFYSLIIS